MNLAASLIAELTLLDVQLIVDGENLRYQGPKGAVTPDHIERLKNLKPEIRQRLIDQEAAIAWRVRIMLASDPPRFDLEMFEPDATAPITRRRPGRCPICDEPQPRGQNGKCVLCALASIRVSRVVDGLDAPPEEEAEGICRLTSHIPVALTEVAS